jgi:hypothetical protein
MTPPDERETLSPPRLDAVETTKQAGGLLYEDEGVVRYVHATTGLDEATVRVVLRSRDRYNLGLGVFPEELAQEGETPEGIRAEHPELFPTHHVASGFVDAGLERQYVAIDSGMAAADVRRILAADLEYTRRVTTD